MKLPQFFLKMGIFSLEISSFMNKRMDCNESFEIHQAYTTLLYPLLLPNGEDRWQL